MSRLESGTAPANHWDTITKERTNAVAGKIEAHLNARVFEEKKEIGPISPEQILAFKSAVLPANEAVLGKIFPGYTEPSADLLAELSNYASAKENYGTAPGEAAALIVQLVRAIKPETAFVFGTARGRLEQLIAKNNPAVEIATIDLPTELVTVAKGKPDTNNIRYRNNIGITDDTKIGDIFSQDSEIASRVHQILGDSFTFDTTQLAGKFRFVVVDGNHQLPNSLMDIASAMELAHRDGAVIVVDDFRKASPLNSGVDGAVSIFC